MTDPKPITVAEAREMVDAHAGIPPDTDVNMSNESAARLWQRILATAQAAERRWVPVTERLPEDGQYVVVTGADEPYDMLYRSGGRWFSPWSNNEQSERYAATFTHWMPLPDQPEV